MWFKVYIYSHLLHTGPQTWLVCVVFFLVSIYNFDSSKQYIGTVSLEIDFLQKKNADSNSYDSDKMAIEFIQSFNSQAFCLGQQVKKRA